MFRSSTFTAVSFLLLSVLVCPHSLAQPANDQSYFNDIQPSITPKGHRDDEYSKKIRPILIKFCNDCHAPGEMENLEFLVPKNGSEITKEAELFTKVVDALDSSIMPPKDSDQPTKAEKKLVVDWIKSHLKKSIGNKKIRKQIASYVVEAFEDKAGNLWFGTVTKGVAKFDGKKLAYFTSKDGLIGNTVAGIAQDKNGNLWFGTHTGASKYDGKSFESFGPSKGLHGEGCNILVDRKGNVWAGTNHGAFRFDGKKFRSFDIPKPKLDFVSAKWEAGKVWTLLEDRQGNIWFGRDGYGVTRFDGKKFTHFTKKDGLPSNNVASISEDKKGNLWFGCLNSDQPIQIQEGGLSRYDGKSFTKFPQVRGLSKNDIYTTFADSKGMVWIGATGVGAYRYDGKQFQLFQKADRPDLTKRFGIQAVLEDRNGTIWFGFSGGLFRFEKDQFKNVTTEGPWKKKPQPKLLW